ALDEQELSKFTGLYTSPELETSYQLLCKDGALVLQRRKYGVTPLKPVVPDTFCCDEFTMCFYRDAHNEIEGVKLTSGRMHNLRFLRQPAA
ncbi:MAG: hypothetical protein AAGU05_11935, partial [Anaerolineaceae bacterium]